MNYSCSLCQNLKPWLKCSKADGPKDYTCSFYCTVDREKLDTLYNMFGGIVTAMYKFCLSYPWATAVNAQKKYINFYADLEYFHFLQRDCLYLQAVANISVLTRMRLYSGLLYNRSKNTSIRVTMYAWHILYNFKLYWIHFDYVRCSYRYQSYPKCQMHHIDYIWCL